MYGGLIAVAGAGRALARAHQDLARPGDPGGSDQPVVGPAGRHQDRLGGGPGVRDRHRRRGRRGRDHRRALPVRAGLALPVDRPAARDRRARRAGQPQRGGARRHPLRPRRDLHLDVRRPRRGRRPSPTPSSSPSCSSVRRACSGPDSERMPSPHDRQPWPARHPRRLDPWTQPIVDRPGGRPGRRGRAARLPARHRRPLLPEHDHPLAGLRDRCQRAQHHLRLRRLHLAGPGRLHRPRRLHHRRARGPHPRRPIWWWVPVAGVVARAGRPGARAGVPALVAGRRS